MKTTSLWNSLRCALNGLCHVLCSERNARIELAATFVAVALGLYLRINLTEWAIIALTIGAVMAAEFANTVAETLVDIASPEKSEPARIAKDVAAGAVLVLAMTSVVVGLLILGPPLVERLVG